METLFFKDSELKGNNIELFFHKDYPYLYNTEEFPVVKFTLTNCQNAQSFDFGWLRDDQDGATIEIVKENSNSIFTITDSSDEFIKITCESVLKEEVKYRKNDLYYLISELVQKQESDNEIIVKVLKTIGELRNHFEKELETIDRKLKEANWLSIETQEFLKGQKSIIEKSMETLEGLP